MNKILLLLTLFIAFSTHATELIYKGTYNNWQAAVTSKQKVPLANSQALCEQCIHKINSITTNNACLFILSEKNSVHHQVPGISIDELYKQLPAWAGGNRGGEQMLWYAIKQSGIGVKSCKFAVNFSIYKMKNFTEAEVND